MSATGTPFIPPTAEQVQTHLEQHPVNPPSPWLAWGPMIVIGLAVFTAVVMPVLVLVPCAMLIGLMITSQTRAGQLRRLEQRLNRAGELAVCRHLPEALRLSWRLLADATAYPPLHQRTQLMIGQILDHVQAYDAALVIYDDVIDRMGQSSASPTANHQNGLADRAGKMSPGKRNRNMVAAVGFTPASGLMVLRFQLQRALALLRSHRLVDADDRIRRLRGEVESVASQPGGAMLAGAYRVLQLMQAVVTNHADDAIELCDDLEKMLRPLGVEAGLGYGLAARAYQVRGGREGSASESWQQAQYWWTNATMLLPAEELVNRLPELQETADALAAAPTFSEVLHG